MAKGKDREARARTEGQSLPGCFSAWPVCVQELHGACLLLLVTPAFDELLPEVSLDGLQSLVVVLHEHLLHRRARSLPLPMPFSLVCLCGESRRQGRRQMQKQGQGGK